MKHITLYTETAMQADPGLTAVGVRMVNESGVVLLEKTALIGNAAAATAQFAAVVFALESAAAYFDNEPPQQHYSLVLSNEAVKRQLSGEQVVNDPGIVPHFIQIYNLRVDYFRELEVAYAPVKQSNELTALVKAALDGETSVA